MSPSPALPWDFPGLPLHFPGPPRASFTGPPRASPGLPKHFPGLPQHFPGLPQNGCASTSPCDFISYRAAPWAAKNEKFLVNPSVEYARKCMITALHTKCVCLFAAGSTIACWKGGLESHLCEVSSKVIQNLWEVVRRGSKVHGI